MNNISFFSIVSFATEDEYHQFTERKLSPLNTFGLKPYRFNTKNGFLEIDKEGVLSLEITNIQRKIYISPDGMKVIFFLFHRVY